MESHILARAFDDEKVSRACFAIEESLTRLQTDYLDIYYRHALGASNPVQLTEDPDAFEHGPLSEDAVPACDGVWQKLRGITPKYNR